MDWPRAKSWLLISFALLNLFLFLQYKAIQEAQMQTYTEQNLQWPLPGSGFLSSNGSGERMPEEEQLPVGPVTEEDGQDAEEVTEPENRIEQPDVMEQLRRAGVDLFPNLVPAPHDPLSMLRVRLQRPRAGELARSLFGVSDDLVITGFPGGIQYHYFDEELIVFDLGYIRYENRAANNTVAAPRDMNQSSMKRRVEALDTAEAFLRKLPPIPEDMKLDEINAVDPFTDVVRYVQVYSGIPIFGTLNGRPIGGYLQITIKNGQVVLFEMNRLEVLQTVGSPKKLLTPIEALLQLTRQVSRPEYGFPVQDIVLGYFAGVYREVESWETVPAWRIRLRDGTSYYINAFTGLLEKQNIGP